MKKQLITNVAYKSIDGTTTRTQAPQNLCSDPALAKQLAGALYRKFAYVPVDIRKAVVSMADFTDGATTRVAVTVAIRNLIQELEQIIPAPQVNKRRYPRKGNNAKVIKEDLASMGVSLEENSNEQES